MNRSPLDNSLSTLSPLRSLDWRVWWRRPRAATWRSGPPSTPCSPWPAPCPSPQTRGSPRCPAPGPRAGGCCPARPAETRSSSPRSLSWAPRSPRPGPRSQRPRTSSASWSTPSTWWMWWRRDSSRYKAAFKCFVCVSDYKRILDSN